MQPGNAGRCQQGTCQLLLQRRELRSDLYVMLVDLHTCTVRASGWLPLADRIISNLCAIALYLRKFCAQACSFYRDFCSSNSSEFSICIALRIEQELKCGDSTSQCPSIVETLRDCLATILRSTYLLQDKDEGLGSFAPSTPTKPRESEVTEIRGPY